MEAAPCGHGAAHDVKHRHLLAPVGDDKVAPANAVDRFFPETGEEARVRGQAGHRADRFDLVRDGGKGHFAVHFAVAAAQHDLTEIVENHGA